MSLADGMCPMSRRHIHLCCPSALLVACCSVAYLRQGEQSTDEPAHVPPIAVAIRAYPRTEDHGDPCYRPGNRSYEERVLNGCVDVAHGRDDAEQQRGEKLVVFDDTIGDERGGRVHWSRGGLNARRIALSRAERRGLSG